jgi:pimeloyl-ACP methyl ester carboxylesterase
MIAPMVAARNKEVGFIILLAAPGIKGDSLMFLQRKLTTDKKAFGGNKKEIEKMLNLRRRQDSVILHTADTEQLERNLTALFEEFYEKQAPSLTPEEKEEAVRTEVRFFTSKFYQYFIKYDPVLALKQVQCPVLALNGEKDVQVSAEENLNAIEKILLEAGNTDITIRKFPKLNHLFQTSQTGAFSEYAEIEETFSQEVLEIMFQWIERNTKK